MKLKNKQTGEIANFVVEGDVIRESCLFGKIYYSLAELNAEWEDYHEEPKGCWIINIFGVVEYTHFRNEAEAELLKEIGNYFETKEEAEKAVEKLKAWKRLKDKGFRFDGWKCTGSMSFTFDNYCGDGQPMSASDYLDLLFGGKE